MPNAMKKSMLKELLQQFRECENLLFIGYQGLTAKGADEIRAKLDKVGAEMQVVKNSIAGLMLKEMGHEDAGKRFLQGQMAIISGKDPAAMAKVLTTLEEGIKIELKGGVMGKKLLSQADTKVLADLPPREVMLAQVAGLLQSPVSKCASLLQAPIRELYNCLNALKEKKS